MKHQIARKDHARRLVVAAAMTTALMAGGCTHFAGAKMNAETELQKQSRVLTTAVVDVLELQPEQARDTFSATALEIARVDQRIEGFPAEAIPVGAMLQSTNPRVAAAARGELDERFARIDQLRSRERSAAERLLEYGARFEEERNRTRWRLFKWAGGGTLLIGALAALCVFVPAVVPLVARFAGWLVGRIPALAGSAGVVSVSAFDAVVKAVERTRKAGTQTLGNEVALRAEADLELNLSRAMDSAHKALVKRRKEALNLQP